MTTGKRSWPVLLSGCRAGVAAVGVLIAATAGGCALCANPYDQDFPVYGGLRERIDRQHGRVGSVFDPAAATGSERLVPVERSFVPPSGFRSIPGGDWSADEESVLNELPAPGGTAGGAGGAGATQPPGEADLEKPAFPPSDEPAPPEFPSDEPLAPQVPDAGEPSTPPTWSEEEGGFNVNDLFPTDGS